MDKDLMFLRQEDLVNNPTTRLPVCLCLDVSGSMAGKPIEDLKKGVENFLTAIKMDEVARYSVELAIVTFDSKADVALDFISIDRQTIPELQARGLNNPIGKKGWLKFKPPRIIIKEKRKRAWNNLL